MNFNFINFLFFFFFLMSVVLGLLLTIEKYLPESLCQIFIFGKHAFKGERSTKIVEKIEVPKAWFSHYYNFALLLSWSTMIMGVCVYFYGYIPHKHFIEYLDVVCGRNREVKSN